MIFSQTLAGGFANIAIVRGKCGVSSAIAEGAGQSNTQAHRYFGSLSAKISNL
jgi:hypothetical protein